MHHEARRNARQARPRPRVTPVRVEAGVTPPIHVAPGAQLAWQPSARWATRDTREEGEPHEEHDVPHRQERLVEEEHDAEDREEGAEEDEGAPDLGVVREHGRPGGAAAVAGQQQILGTPVWSGLQSMEHLGVLLLYP